tara:strand:+ start:6704 stop:7105 length:402 start_codon:yes stop_codon:yes gene_type:complete
MAHTEKQLWKRLRDNLPDIFWQRLESGMTAPGIPDLFGCIEGRYSFIELKCVRGKKIRLSNKQINWQRRAESCGVRTTILAWQKTKSIDRFYIWDGKHAADIARMGIDWVQADVYDAPFDWDDIAIALVGFED